METNFRLVQASLKPILWRLMVPLAIVMSLLVVGFTTGISIQHNRQLEESCQWILKDVIHELSAALDEQSRALTAVEAALIQGTELRGLLKSQDRQRLLDIYAPVFTKLKADYSLTHFYFIDIHRICLLRLHKPEKYGDLIDRFTALEAERTGKAASGIEIGPLGTFTLRVVQPVFDGETLIGYLELGKEIEDVLAGIHQQTGVELAVTLKRNALNREPWEAGMKMLGREAEWERFPKDALVYSTLSPFPVEAGPFVGEQGHQHGKTIAEAHFNDAAWRVMVWSLQDASGIQAGDLIVMHNISAFKSAGQKFMIRLTGSAIGLLSILFSFIFILLRRTDAGIQTRQADLCFTFSLLEASLDATADGLLIVNREGKVTRWNQKFAALWRLPETVLATDDDEVLINTILSQLSDPDQFVSKVKDIYGQPERSSFDIIRFSDGRIFERYSQPQKLNGTSIGRVWSFRDVTEHKQAEELLRESETRFKSLHNASFGGIAIHDKGVILECNHGLVEMAGYSMDELIGMNGLLLIAEKSRPAVMDNILSGYEKPYEAMGLRKNGEEFPMRLEARNVPYKGKQVRTVEFRDITDQKQAELEREKLQVQLTQSQKMESIGTLAGGIAHDFNNILYPIVGHTEMLMEDLSEENSSIRNSLDEIYTSALRARDLVQQILAFARQEKNELKLMKLQPIIVEALKLIRSTIPTTIAITQHLNPDCGPVSADPTQIHQIVINLATNAYHAMAENGGEFKVGLKEIELGKDDRINPEMSPGGYACLTFADTGMGMNKDIMDRIFEPFFTTKEPGKGTGMGLSVVHGIVKGMKGYIQVHSEPGKGTEFCVYLPVVKNASEKQESRTDHPIPGGCERVLLVDDEEVIVAMERQVLERFGYQVVFCNGSMEALEAFRAAPDQFDLVITDLAMPNMAGDKLAVELIKIRPDIPILLCTGFSETMTTEKIESLGIRGLILKPIIIRDLAQKIREVLDTERK